MVVKVGLRSLPFDRTLLLSRRWCLLELMIDKEVGQNPAGTPIDAVRPAFDARSI